MRVSITELPVEGARAVLKGVRDLREARARRLPRFATVRGNRAEPFIYYLAPTPSGASGGVRNIYRHVDTLNGMGCRAAVVHATSGYRAAWFQNDTAIVDPRRIQLYDNDVLVVPEYYGTDLASCNLNCRIVIFNQGAHYTYSCLPYSRSAKGDPYRGVRNLSGILTVSVDSANVLKFAYPDLPVQIARLVIDGSVFHPEHRVLPPSIAFLTHRRTHEREMLLHMLRARGVIDGWQLRPIENRTEDETAQIMRSSPLFLSLSEREGFGLPPAEAMASGCYVIGYTGMGGDEYFDPNYSCAVRDGDSYSFAEAVKRACESYEVDPDRTRTAGAIASSAVLERYGEAGLIADLRAFYAPLLTL